jgi:hypothetical protein
VASSALIIKSGSAANVKGSALQSWQPHSAPWQWSVVFTTWLVSCTAVDLGLFFVLASQLGSMKSPSYHTRHAIARLLLLSFVSADVDSMELRCHAATDAPPPCRRRVCSLLASRWRR